MSETSEHLHSTPLVPSRLAQRNPSAARKSLFFGPRVKTADRTVADARSAESGPAVESMSIHRRPEPKAVPSRQQRSTVLSRQFVRANAAKRTSSKARKRMNTRPRNWALASLALILFVFGVRVGVM